MNSTPESETHPTHNGHTTHQEFVRRALEHALCGIYVYDVVDGHNEYINPQYTRITGWTLDEINAMASDEFAELFHPDDRERVFAHMQEVLTARDGQTLEIEYRFKDKGGNWIWCLSRDTPFDRGEDGTVTHFTGTLLDITERKQAEEAVQKSRKRLGDMEAVVNGSPFVIFLWRAEAEVWPVEFVSENVEHLTGYTAKEFMSGEVSWPGITHPDDEGRLEAEVAGYFERGEWQWSQEYRLIKKSGDVVWVQDWNRAILDDAGNIASVQALAMDTTERKRREESRREMEVRLQQTQRLESLGVLAGGIAHDFNNILMGIMGHADLAMEDLSAMSPARASVAEIRTASLRAAELCSQMLAYSGKGSFESSDIDLGGLIGEVLHMLKTSISKKCILNLNLEKELPCMHGDPAQIRQILMNLVMNGSEAIGDRSGVVTISTGAMDCPAEYLAENYVDEALEPGLYVYIEVSDTGCGIDPEAQRHIFEPFFTTKFTGRGLGLSAVMGIVRAHNGALRVYSEVGKGTTFKALFPAATGPGQESETHPEEGGWTGTGTVLLVDDEESVRAVSGKLLQRLGLEVVTAADGKEAIAAYRERQADIDVILLDLTMPRMNGEEAYRELRKIDPAVRVVLASGYSESDVSARFAGKGLAGCLQKPYSLAKLRGLLSGLLPGATPPDAT